MENNTKQTLLISALLVGAMGALTVGLYLRAIKPDDSTPMEEVMAMEQIQIPTDTETMVAEEVRPGAQPLSEEEFSAIMDAVGQSTTEEPEILESKGVEEATPAGTEAITDVIEEIPIAA